VAPVLGAVLLAGACGGGSAPARTSQRGLPAFQRVLDRIGDDGAIDRDTALQAFALAFTPPPGVKRPPGPSEPIQSGSGPLRWVMSHFNELTPAQQRAVRAVVPRPSRTEASRPDGMTLLASGEQADFENLVAEAYAFWSGKFPSGSLLHPTNLRSVTLNGQNLWNASAYTFPVDAPGGMTGPVHQCDIYFNPIVRSGTAAQKREAAFHEVFHCFEAQMAPDLTGYYAESQSPTGRFGPASWLMEGGAAWAMDVAVGPSGATPYGAVIWKQYFATPTTPLFKRVYDAIGFFAHLQEAGVDVFARFPAAMQAAMVHGGNVAAFNAFFAGGSAGGFFATWPTSLLRKPALGPEWDAHGPGITSDAVVPSSVVASNGSAAVIGQVPAYANDDRSLSASSDVVVVSAGTYSRMRATGSGFDSATPSAVYCTKRAGCTCPQGSPQAGTAFKPLSTGSYYLALGGGPAGNPWSLAPFGLDQFCQQPAAAACLYGTWRLTTPPPIALPASVSLQRLDEVLTITQAGLMTVDVDVVDSSQLRGTSVTAEVKGRITIHTLAVGGVIEPKGADFSGLGVTASVGGVSVIHGSVGQMFPGLENQLTPVAYRCAGGTLLLQSQTGTQSTWTRA
jgi:hypothetical protein